MDPATTSATGARDPSGAVRAARRRSACPHAALWLAASTVILTAGFFLNLWRAAEPAFFRDFQRDTESLVVGRLVQSRQESPLSFAGLPGAFADLGRGRRWVSADDVKRQYRGYLQGERLTGYAPYLSHHGGQGVAFSLLDRIVPLSPWWTLYSFRLLTSVLTAAALAAVVVWLRVEVGAGAALGALASLAAARWLAPFGHNLWWSPWALFVPMVAVATVLRRWRRRPGRHVGVAAVVAAAGGGMVLKCAFTGYEFLPAAVVMAMVPVVLVASRDRWSLRHLGASLVGVGVGSAAAVACSAVVLVLQVGAVAGGPAAAVDHLVRSAAKRTHGDAARFAGAHADALEAGALEVVGESLGGVFVSVRPPRSPSDHPRGEGVVTVRFWHLLVALAVASTVVWPWSRSAARPERSRDRAVVAAAWFSLLAPLSWFTVFTAHAAAHPHLDPVVWHMPFTILAAAVVGRAVGRLVGVGR